MECRDISYYLCAYLDGELDSEEARPIKEHLESCFMCQEELDFQKCMKTMVKSQISKIVAPNHVRQVVLTELGRAEDYRESGIKILDLIPWGTHIAQLYEDKNDLKELLVPYIETGLRENELCLWITSEISEDEAKEALAEKIPDLDGYISNGQLQLFDSENWYMSSGRFDGECALNEGLGKCDEALSSGYDGMRITGNFCWLNQSNWHSAMEYERVMDSAIQNQKLLAVCLYKKCNCTRQNIADVIDAHKYVISKTDDMWNLRRLEEVQ